MSMFDEMIADKVFEQLGPDFISGVIEQIDTKKLSEAINKALIAAVKEVYWTDVLNDVMADDRITKILTDRIIATLKQ